MNQRFLICGLGVVMTALSFPAAEAAEPDSQALHAAVQQICPVSGVELGKHGAPLRVAVGEQEQEVFLCCKACLQKEINPEHWATIHANTLAAQGRCPVMKKPLPEDAHWQVIEGRVVFVCCPPCVEKIVADPKPHMELLDSFYAASLETKTEQ